MLPTHARLSARTRCDPAVDPCRALLHQLRLIMWNIEPTYEARCESERATCARKSPPSPQPPPPPPPPSPTLPEAYRIAIDRARERAVCARKLEGVICNLCERPLIESSCVFYPPSSKSREEILKSVLCFECVDGMSDWFGPHVAMRYVQVTHVQLVLQL